MTPNAAAALERLETKWRYAAARLDAGTGSCDFARAETYRSCADELATLRATLAQQGEGSFEVFAREFNLTLALYPEGLPNPEGFRFKYAHTNAAWRAWVASHPAAVDERLAEAIIAGIGNIPYQTLTVEDVMREVTAALQPATSEESP